MIGKTNTQSGSKIFTVTFDSNGGSEVLPLKIVSGQTAKEPNPPIYTNHVFYGWLLNDEYFDFDTPITENIVLTAKWDAQQVNYTILYDYGDVGESGDWEYKVISDSSNSKDKAFASYVFNKNEDNMYLEGTPASGYNSKGAILTINKFDMSIYNMVYCKSGIDKYGRHAGIYLKTLLEDDTNLNTANPTSITLHKTPWDSAALSNSNPSLFSSLNTSGNRKIAFYIESNGYNSVISGYLYHLTLFKPDTEYNNLANIMNIEVSSINEILENSSILLNNREAVQYMLSTLTGDFMATAIQSNAFLTELNNSPYKDLVYANEHWSKFLNMLT